MNQYDLIEVIGEGTYGIVMKCRHRPTGKIVAVKRFKYSESNEYVRCTMMRELRVEQLLKGEPYVVQLLDSFRREGRLHLVMEYVQYTMLDVLDLQPHGLELGSLKVLIYTLLLGIRSCHSNGIIHRDVKPENILVRPDGTAALCDFGFSRPTATTTTLTALTDSTQRWWGGSRSQTPTGVGSSLQQQQRTGSPASQQSPARDGLVLSNHLNVMTDYVATRWYRSPEMLLGMPQYDYAVDVWAVGAIMAEAADGHPLLPGKTELEQLSLIQERIGDFPPEYRALVKQRAGGALRLQRAMEQPHNPLIGPVSMSQCAGGRGGRRNTYLEDRFLDKIGEDGVGLLRVLLASQARDRATAEEALTHPFFEGLAERFGPQCSPCGGGPSNNALSRQPSGLSEAASVESEVEKQANAVLVVPASGIANGDGGGAEASSPPLWGTEPTSPQFTPPRPPPQLGQQAYTGARPVVEKAGDGASSACRSPIAASPPVSPPTDEETDMPRCNTMTLPERGGSIESGTDDAYSAFKNGDGKRGPTDDLRHQTSTGYLSDSAINTAPLHKPPVPTRTRTAVRRLDSRDDEPVAHDDTGTSQGFQRQREWSAGGGRHPSSSTRITSATRKRLAARALPTTSRGRKSAFPRTSNSTAEPSFPPTTAAANTASVRCGSPAARTKARKGTARGGLHRGSKQLQPVTSVAHDSAATAGAEAGPATVDPSNLQKSKLMREVESLGHAIAPPMLVEVLSLSATLQEDDDTALRRGGPITAFSHPPLIKSTKRSGVKGTRSLKLVKDVPMLLTSPLSDMSSATTMLSADSTATLHDSAPAPSSLSSSSRAAVSSPPLVLSPASVITPRISGGGVGHHLHVGKETPKAGTATAGPLAKGGGGMMPALYFRAKQQQQQPVGVSQTGFPTATDLMSPPTSMCTTSGNCRVSNGSPAFHDKRRPTPHLRRTPSIVPNLDAETHTPKGTRLSAAFTLPAVGFGRQLSDDVDMLVSPLSCYQHQQLRPPSLPAEMRRLSASHQSTPSRSDFIAAALPPAVTSPTLEVSPSHRSVSPGEGGLRPPLSHHTESPLRQPPTATLPSNSASDSDNSALDATKNPSMEPVMEDLSPVQTLTLEPRSLAQVGTPMRIITPRLGTQDVITVACLDDGSDEDAVQAISPDGQPQRRTRTNSASGNTGGLHMTPSSVLGGGNLDTVFRFQQQRGGARKRGRLTLGPPVTKGNKGLH